MGNGIGWILIGDKFFPSSRIIGMNVNAWFQKNGVNSTILVPPYDCGNLNVVIFQKVYGPEFEHLMSICKSQGKKVVYILDDLFAESIPLARIADLIVCGSEYLKTAINQYSQAPTVVMPAAYETPRDFYKKEYQTDKIKVVWFGTMLHLPQAHDVEQTIKNLGYEYIIISSGPNCTKQWSLETIWNDVIECDIVVLPYIGKLPPYELAKGNTRLTQSMVLGMPVVVSPIPNYLPTIQNYKNGFICYNNNVEDFQFYLTLLQSAEYRKDIGEHARRDVIDAYSIDTVGNRWKELLNSLIEKKSAEELEVSIVINNYNYGAYLDETIQSCINQTHSPDEIIIIDDCSTDNSVQIIKEYHARCPNLIKYKIFEQNWGARERPLNVGISMARGKYIVAVDADDALLPNFIENMLPKFADERVGIVRIANNRVGMDNYFQAPRPWTSNDRLKDMLEANHILSTSPFRRKVWEDVHGFDETETIRIALGDYDFWIRAVVAGWEIADAIDIPTVRYRVHADSGSFTRNFGIPLEYLKKKFADLIEQKGIVIGPLSANWKG